ncbi:MAG: 4'-phosphopantetheinyl transferase superfamily protein [Bacteroidetes bacterium]|nr:4'-phosphopantetheinyl transferase superfamily protein [Bacteroidota bacterium]
MVKVYFSSVNKNYINNFGWYLNSVPKPFKDKIMKYKFVKDRYIRLLGKLLLIEGFKREGYEKDIINKIEYNRYGKPYIIGGPNFNISYTDDFVIGAFSLSTELGIDIERIRKIDLLQFKQVLRDDEWKFINEKTIANEFIEPKSSTNKDKNYFSLSSTFCEDEDRYKRFFDLWTKKEAIVKAYGIGLNIDLKEVFINNKNYGFFHLCNNNKLFKTSEKRDAYSKCYLYKLKIHKNISVNLATKKQVFSVCKQTKL